MLESQQVTLQPPSLSEFGKKQRNSLSLLSKTSTKAWPGAEVGKVCGIGHHYLHGDLECHVSSKFLRRKVILNYI
jgi:hypothetical protein